MGPRMRMALPLAFAMSTGGPALAAPPAVVVRASEVARPCVAAALEAAGVAGIRVVPGDVRGDGPADVLVGGSVEIDRALESGLADADSDESVGAVGWMLVGGGAGAPRSPAEAAGGGAELAVPGGPDGDAVRRALARAGGRPRPVPVGELAAFSLRVVPSWDASAAAGVRLDVRPLRVRAAASRAAADPDRAREVSRALGSEAARRAFARCTGER